MPICFVVDQKLSSDWKTHFQNLWSQGTQPSDLLSALESHGLSERDYLTWAQANHFLAEIQESFVPNYRPDPKFWLWVQDLYPWSPHYFAFAQWDGHILVVGLEPQALPKSIKGIQFLASREVLSQLWEALQKSRGSFKPQIPELPTLQALNSPAELQALMDQESLRDLQKENTPDAPIEENKPQELEMPEGLNNEPTLVDTQVPDGLALSPPADPVTLTSKVELNSSSDRREDSTTAKLSPETQESTKTFKLSLSLNSKPLENPQMQTPPPSSPEEITQAPTTSSKAPSGSYKVKTSGEDFLQKLKKKNAKVFEESAQFLCEEIKAHFESVWILSYFKPKNLVQTLASSEAHSEAKTFELQGPSFLKILAQTERPFHGPPHLNEENEKILEALCGAGTLPDHLTIIPVILEEELIGMIFITGTKSAYTSQALKYAEQSSSKWFQKLLSGFVHEAA